MVLTITEYCFYYYRHQYSNSPGEKDIMFLCKLHIWHNILILIARVSAAVQAKCTVTPRF